MGKILFLFEFGYIIYWGWGKSPLPLDIFTSNIPYIQKKLYCVTVVCHCIHVMYKCKGKYAEQEEMVEREACVPLNLPKPHLA